MKVKTGNNYYAQALAFTEGWQTSTSSSEVGYLNGANNNAMGFSVKPAGQWPTTTYIAPYASTYTGFGQTAAFWSSDRLAFGMSFWSGATSLGGYSGTYETAGTSTIAKSAYLSVRCIRSSSNGEANTVPSPTVETYPSSQAISNLTTTSATLTAGRIVTDGDMSPLTDITKYGYVRSTASGSFNDATLRLGKTNTTYGSWTTTITSFPYQINSLNITGLTSNTTYYYRAFAINAQNDTVYGAVKSFKTESNEKACTSIAPNAENITDAASNSYPTVAVGSQCWLGSNMRITKYADGTSLSSSTYKSTSGGLTNYGYLYSYEAAMRGTYASTGNVQGICPANWHMPSASEVQTMKTTMEGTTAYQCNSTSTNIAKAMASKSGWTSSSTTCAVGNDLNANNTSGFNLYPTGYYNGSTYNNYQSATYLWNVGPVSTGNTYYGMNNNSVALGAWNSTNTGWYFAVRCVYGGNYAPAVATGSVSSVSVKTATISGTLNHAGTGSVTALGICYSSSNENPTTSNYTKVASGTGTGSFSVDLSGLTSGTVYYYRTYATNSYGTSYGKVKTFTTTAGKTIANGGRTIGTTTVTLNGIITNGDLSTETVQKWGFYLYKKQSDGSFSEVLDAYTDATYSPTTYNGYTYQLTSAPQSGTYTMQINGLEPGATYKYQAEIKTDVQGWIYATLSPEFTQFHDPAVTMTSVSYSGSGNSFTYTANVTDVGDPAYTERGFVYSTTTTSPTVGGTNCYQISASGTSSSTGSYNRTDTWYSPNVTRHVRAYLKKSSGAYVYSTNYVTFTTPDVPNSGSYNGFSDNYTSPYKYSAHVTANSIEMKANFDNTGGSPRTASGLIFTTSQSLATATFNPSTIQISTSLSDTATKWVKVSVASSNAYVPVTISGLKSNTTYYIRSFSTNAFGTGYSTTYYKVKTAVNCGEDLTDQNGNTYGTTKIGTQCWMKTNLKATKYDNTRDLGGSGATTITSNTASSSNMSTTTRYYYTPSGGVNYGYLYNWPAATGYGVTNNNTGSNMVTIQGKTQGACPRGWHIPTQSEMSTLFGNLAYTSYKNAFIGTDSYAYKYPGYIAAAGFYAGVNVNVRFWTTTTYNSTHYNYYYTSSGSRGYETSSSFTDANALSVRCVQDIAY